MKRKGDGELSRPACRPFERQAEISLREHADLLDLTHDAMFVRDMDTAIKYWNRGAEEMYGWTAEEALGKSALELLKTLSTVPLDQIESQVLRTGRWEGELVHHRRDGTPVVVASRLALQRDEQGRPVAILATNTDITERKRAEEARQELEEQWRAAFEANPTMYFILDAAGTILSVNPVGAEQLGWRVDELVGQPVLNVFLEADRAFVQGKAEEAFRQPGRVMRWKARKVRKDGSLLWVRESANAVVLRNGPVLLVACEDITERQQTEEALRESEERFRTLVKFSFDVYWESDAQHRFTRQEYSARFDRAPAPGSEIGKTRWEVPYLAPDEEAWRQHRATLDAHVPFRDFELARPTPDGGIRHVSVSGLPMFDEAGRFTGYRGVGRDITERKRAEQLTRQVFESASDGMAVIDRDYRYQRVNAVYAQSWKMPAEQIIGMRVADLHGTDFFERTVKPSLDRCFAGEQFTFAEWFTTEMGRVYLSVSYSPLRLASERLEAALVITRDLTHHILASEALREAQAALARVNRVTTLGVLAASIAHEVNQPLGAMVMSAGSCARWLAARPPEIEKAQRSLERIARDGKRASEVIDRIRALVMRQPPRRDRVDINQVILDVIAFTRDQMRRNDIALEKTLAEGLPRVWGDRVQLQQVILNLIVNAIEAMSGPGDGARELVVGASEAEGGVCIEVRDSGPGIAPEIADKLFEPFHTSKAQGIGMGLSISRSIIEAHGGQLWTAPNLPHGAVFRFSLPVGEWGP
ncbi:PAS domain S-box-containing protein [Variovorax sp. HW608]|uniref:PAS domain S-box protein n=1 Tax=Variovorax sp. HW608 TaxID=1034889 RepID=UPI00082009D1|nr:PAS domain S-box protein [Variovorax sp. HW608]SCK12994.1 PAS domain S-box-containing protein [Variovorax sp. HW608]